MDIDVAFVFSGWVKLTPSQQAALIELIRQHQASHGSGQRLLEHKANERISLGPLASARCSCCGK